MSHHDETALSGPDRRGLVGYEAPRVGYEAPRVERVLTPAELEREILFAGDSDSPASDGG